MYFSTNNLIRAIFEAGRADVCYANMTDLIVSERSHEGRS